MSAKQYLLNHYRVVDAEYATLGNTTMAAFGHAETAMAVMVVEFLDALPFGTGEVLLEKKARTHGWTGGVR